MGNYNKFRIVSSSNFSSISRVKPSIAKMIAKCSFFILLFLCPGFLSSQNGEGLSSLTEMKNNLDRRKVLMNNVKSEYNDTRRFLEAIDPEVFSSDSLILVEFYNAKDYVYTCYMYQSKNKSVVAMRRYSDGMRLEMKPFPTNNDRAHKNIILYIQNGYMDEVVRKGSHSLVPPNVKININVAIRHGNNYRIKSYCMDESS